MNERIEVRDFLMSRRARVTPGQAGVVCDGEVRRVAGLRREEVAALAGMSIDYYKRLERGNLRGASDAVLEALAVALNLDTAERAHLANLARYANQSIRSRSRPVTHPQLDPSVSSLVDQMELPAIVRDSTMRLLGGNDLARALIPQLFDRPLLPANTARTLFLDPRSRSYWADWEQVASSSAAIIRMALGRRPDDSGLGDLVTELSDRSGDFRRIWAYHDVQHHRAGSKRIIHPLVGPMTVGFQSLEVQTDAGPLMIGAFSVDPGTDSALAYARLLDIANDIGRTTPPLTAAAHAGRAEHEHHPHGERNGSREEFSPTVR